MGLITPSQFCNVSVASVSVTVPVDRLFLSSHDLAYGKEQRYHNQVCIRLHDNVLLDMVNKPLLCLIRTIIHFTSCIRISLFYTNVSYQGNLFHLIYIQYFCCFDVFFHWYPNLTQPMFLNHCPPYNAGILILGDGFKLNSCIYE